MEFVDRVTEDDRVLEKVLRSQCHGNPHLIHRAAHVLLFNSQGQLLLQKRSMNKDIQPGKWDTSVGGHVESGEDYEKAAYRELGEELGIKDVPLEYLYDYKMRNEVESENIRSYQCKYDGPILFNHDEIDEIRFWDIAAIVRQLGSGVFTPNFEQEIKLYFIHKNKMFS
ncbi:MAG: NUDIX hydrolase [bacterium]